jgi:FMN-dependent NADH-azoreductase
MSTLLKIDVSPRGEHSISRKLGNHFATEWRSNHVGGKIITRDLATTKLPYVDLPWIAGAFTAPDQHTAEHKAALKISDEIGITDVNVIHAGGTNKVAQGAIPEPAFIEKFVHEVDLAAAK